MRSERSFQDSSFLWIRFVGMCRVQTPKQIVVLAASKELLESHRYQVTSRNAEFPSEGLTFPEEALVERDCSFYYHGSTNSIPHVIPSPEEHAS